MDLDNINFGNQVAENEADNLVSYFIETYAWKKLWNGDVDVVFGSKGAGKSALYTLLLSKHNELFADKGIFLLSAEKPVGKTVFSEIKSSPPTAEVEFVNLWKLYFCQMIVDWLIKNNLCRDEASFVKDKLVEAGLINEENQLHKLLNRAKNFAKKFSDINGVEAGVDPLGSLKCKITFNSPTDDQVKLGYVTIDELLGKINQYLERIDKKCWVLCDRLDVAFDHDADLEKNALRALFKSYRDLEEFRFISVKVFLRDDIWNRITRDGFREASHINKSVTISWNAKNLLNLIVRRALKNNEILTKYGVQEEGILSSYDNQLDFYYKMFPRQVDVGEKQSSTFDWVLSRIRDGLGNTPPRELIHFYNEMVECEIKEQDVSSDNIEEPNIVSRNAIKNSVYNVSKTRLEQTIFAEYPEHKSDIMAFENKKAEHKISTLSEIWGVNEKVAEEKSRSLLEIGFFDLKTAKDDKIFKIPFIYRFHLDVIQGKAY